MISFVSSNLYLSGSTCNLNTSFSESKLPYDFPKCPRDHQTSGLTTKINMCCENVMELTLAQTCGTRNNFGHTCVVKL
jgi:hypothetical protein